ncbi:MAG: glycoside hydrolase [Armatimonadota bacterium]|nr:glycoside hydrolase [Armatimonadota bacterium]
MGKSNSAQPDHGRVPGVVIAHSPAASRAYIGSPALAVLPDGDYIAAHDLFGPGKGYNRTRIFRSRDRGQTWTPLGEIEGAFWSSLFVYDGALYLMGTTREYGFCVIRRSTDGGQTWTTPDDATTGLLLADGEYHTAPVPVVLHNGRIWRAMEDRHPPQGWGVNFRSFVMSAPVDADLLQAANWTCSTRLRYDQTWPGSAWLEGNVVVTPENTLLNLLRTETPEHEQIAAIKISADGQKIEFDPLHGFIDFPGGAKKFTIRFDMTSRLYWSLTNAIPQPITGRAPGSIRNTLALVSSPELKTWTVRAILLQHPDVSTVAFQYVDWLFEGEDIIAVSRTAYDDGRGGAHNFHDANYLTFHRVQSFREAR